VPSIRHLAQAKLQPGDVILSLTANQLTGAGNCRASLPTRHRIRRVKLSVWRDGKEQEVELKVAALNANRPAPPPPEPEKPEPPPSVDVLGLKLTKLTADLRKAVFVTGNGKGALITEVRRIVPEQRKDCDPAISSVAVGHEPIGSLEEVQQKVAAVKKTGHRTRSCE
jgi:serine protease Do